MHVIWNPAVRRETLAAEQEVVNEMLSRCANSQCCKPFLKLREGKLFLVETDRVTRPGELRARSPQRTVEHYWLCDDCATRWTLVYDRERGVALEPARRSVASVVVAIGAAHSGVA